MKILIYGEYFYPIIGGVQTFMDLLGRGFAEFDCRNRLSELGPIEATVVTNTPRGEMDDSTLPYRIVRKPTFLQLARLIHEADLVHVEGPCFLPMLLSWMLGIPFVVEHHVYQAICPNGLLFKQPSRKVCVGHFNKREYVECIRCCSDTMGRVGAIRALLLAFPRRWLCGSASANVMITSHVSRRLQMPRSLVIYYGIVDPGPASRENDGEPLKNVEFGYVGRLVAEKGLPLLIEAANHLACNGGRFRLIFIGDGPERARLEELVTTVGLGKRVEFLGEKLGAELVRIANRIDAIIMPSVWEETAGLAAMEQMMRGRLVIAADIGGLGEIVGDAGLKFEPGDWRSLADQMQRVIDDSSLVSSLGSAARARATKLFGRNAMIENQISLCKEIVAR